MFIDAPTKEFALVKNAIPSYGIAFEYLLYYKMVANFYKNIDNIFIVRFLRSFPFMLI